MMYLLTTINLITFILLCGISDVWTSGIGNVPWQDFVNDIGCKSEIQPLVEYYNLNGTQYVFFSQKVTWEEASMLCETYNAKLAILDNMKKATSIAVTMADSNLGMEDTWLGGRRSDNQIWTWMVSEISNQMNSLIPLQSNAEEYPPWSRAPTRPAKECLAIDRRGHSDPLFVDLDCRLLRPFICEKRTDDSFKKPIPSKRIKINKSTFILYHGKVTWHEAAAYCRSFAARLAILKNPNIIEMLTHSMIKARPAFESLWIGAHFSYGQWVWMATGTILNAITDTRTGYPPWSTGQSKRSDGCLLFDRHHGDIPQFMETNCDRKRDFVCEEYSEDEMDDWLNEPMKFAYNKEVYIIYPLDKTWEESRAFCEERGSILAYLNDINATNMIIEAMGDHPRGISHVWVGATLSRSNEWKWIANGNVISKTKNSLGFPPWINMNDRYDYLNSNLSCLNLDRSDHIKPFIYGLDCHMKQPFVCKITCHQPPYVENGNWTCDQNETKKTCKISCAENYIMMGVSTISCSPQFGWETESNWFEIPLCLAPTDFAKRLTRSVDEVIKRSLGYYVVLDHSDPNVRPLLLKLIIRLLNIFPINEDMKFGLFSGITNPPVHLNFTHIDHCSILQKVQSMEGQISVQNSIQETNFEDLEREFSTFNGQKAVIIGVIDGTHSRQYERMFSRLKTSGHQIFIIGMKSDEKLLTPLASTSTNRRRTVNFFEAKDLNKIITEIQKMERSDHYNCSLLETQDSLKQQPSTGVAMEVSTEVITIVTSLPPIFPSAVITQISTSVENSTNNPIIKESSTSPTSNVEHPVNETTNESKPNETTVIEPSIANQNPTVVVKPMSDATFVTVQPNLENTSGVPQTTK